MKIIFLIKGNLERNVPIITQIMVALEKKYEVSVICSKCDIKLFDLLEKKGAKIYCSSHNTFGTSIIKKVSDWYGVRKNFKEILHRIYTNRDILYIGSVDTALAMGKEIMKYPYILHIRELYDTHPIYLKLMRPFAQSAKVVIIPEYSRAAILKCWLNLKKTPVVIPNKTYDHPRKRNIKIYNYDLNRMINSLSDKKILLYQGHIGRDRGIKELIGSLMKNLDDNYVLVLMGQNHDGFVEELISKYPRVYHINHVPAPFHLQITSHAYIGLVTYDDSNLNNIFCAPNKIYEYSGFGIPILGRDIPGLKYTIGNNNAGLCVDITNENEVQQALREIDKNYNFYSENASKFFEDTDLEKLFGRIMKEFD
ncbi:glycosyltransferase [Ureibacillus terrenus]|uniref:Glycosyltransferase family 4 protein n=1 Tax=Ureibacillus terrenus TaxID=118246 RepID=A0A540V2G6_9BACL|nr:glycosyltransferase [Ureibacillus terrenus]TQE90942.1 glycosyltransferase family 4 protein [Ureibacillus terrenus]